MGRQAALSSWHPPCSLQSTSAHVSAVSIKLLIPHDDLAELFPDRFNNKTNGVTPRRWLLLANPLLARAITEAIGDAWVTDLGHPQDLNRLIGGHRF